MAAISGNEDAISVNEDAISGNEDAIVWQDDVMMGALIVNAASKQKQILTRERAH